MRNAKYKIQHSAFIIHLLISTFSSSKLIHASDHVTKATDKFLTLLHNMDSKE